MIIDVDVPFGSFSLFFEWWLAGLRPAAAFLWFPEEFTRSMYIGFGKRRHVIG